MPPANQTFYLYLGLHSLLIGMFPFYLPVFMWQQGGGMASVALLIAIAGGGFNAGLWCWDRLRHRLTLNQMFLITSLLLFALLLNVRQYGSGLAAMLALGFSYGLYNSFFWTTQRAMFIEVSDPSRSGRAYGNFQLFVFALLQAGILIGGWLLERDDFDLLLLASIVIAAAGSAMLFVSKPVYPSGLRSLPAMSLAAVFSFRDTEHSRTMFVVDGLFLFLESFFWVISLFLLSRESFTTLGIVVIVLALIFGGLFYLLKNTIDRLGVRRVFTLAVMLYGCSWLLRAYVNESMHLLTLFVVLVLITFATSFFRLALNKRFYDLARQTPHPHRYLVTKSYYSQLSITGSFAVLALLAWLVSEPQTLLRSAYWLAALLTPLFLLYGANRYRSNDV
jgi:MFS family permease